MTMEQLAHASSVSSKTISLYEHTPPKRPSRKVIDKLAHALDIPQETLLGAIGSKGRAAKGRAPEAFEETIELGDAHVARILSLLDKEILELQGLMVESASLAGDHPSLAKCVEYLSADIDILTEIKARLA